MEDVTPPVITNVLEEKRSEKKVLNRVGGRWCVEKYEKIKKQGNGGDFLITVMKFK